LKLEWVDTIHKPVVHPGTRSRGVDDGCGAGIQNVRTRSDYLTGARKGQPPPAHVPFDPKRILDRMDAAGVDLAMVCSLAQRIENDFIISLVKAHPQRLFGFGQVMPQADDALDEIARMAEGGLSGLKLHPSLHGYHVADHGLLDPVFEQCERYGLPVLFRPASVPGRRRKRRTGWRKIST